MSPSGLIAHSPPRPRLHLAHLCRGHILADNLPAEIHKRLVNVSPAARARFVIRRVAPRLRNGKCTRPRHCPVFFQIGFIADDDEGDAGVVFDPHDLIPELVQFGEGGERCDAKDEEEALAGFHVKFPTVLVRKCFGFCGETGIKAWMIGAGQGGCDLPHGRWERYRC